MNLHNYFISLEKRFTELTDHIEICEDNYSVYSKNLTILLMSSCSEFEIVCKQIATTLQQKVPRNIKEIFHMLNQAPKYDDSDIFKEKIDLYPYKITIIPFEDWDHDNSPFWWKAYNNVKHNRFNSFKEGNLKSLIYSLGALSIVNHYYLWHKNHPRRSRRAPLISINYLPNHFLMQNMAYDLGPYASDLFEIPSKEH